MILTLAQQIDPKVYLRSMHQQFANPNPHLWWEILLGVTLVAGVFILVMLSGVWERWRSHRGEMAPLGLYHRILAGIGLPYSDRFRLWRMAKATRVPHPTALLLSAELYDETVKKYCASRGLMGSRIRSAPAFATIRRHLFE